MEMHLSHLFFWLAVILAGLFLYALGLVVYRVFLHPLAKYPGPFLAKISDAYILYYAWRGDRHLEFWRLHKQYGDVVRFGPNSLSFNSNVALKEIYGHRANVRKSEFYDAFVHPTPNTHNTRDVLAHARKRRVLSQAFSDGAVKQMERYILANIRTFCGELARQDETYGSRGVPLDTKGWSSPKNMANWCNYLAMDILGDLCFGKAFHMLESPDNRYAISLVGFAAQRHLLCGTMPIINKLSLDKVLFRKISAGRARYVAYSRAQLGERTTLGEESDRRDFFYHLLKARDPETGAGFSMPELWGESNLLIIAGSDTTSTAMAATLFYLVRNPKALARVTSEIRNTFQAVEDIRQGAALTGCVYLRACIDEAMRLSPSVGGILPRQVQAGGMTIQGLSIPAGTVVGAPHYTLHHNHHYYPEPFSYSPERWIVGASLPSSLHAPKAVSATVSEEDVSRAQSAFCPFSIGPRGCIGKGLAYIEMTLTLARVLFLYDVRRSAGVKDPGEGDPLDVSGRHRPGEYQLFDVFTSLKDGPMIEFFPRDGASLRL